MEVHIHGRNGHVFLSPHLLESEQSINPKFRSKDQYGPTQPHERLNANHDRYLIYGSKYAVLVLSRELAG